MIEEIRKEKEEMKRVAVFFLGAILALNILPVVANATVDKFGYVDLSKIFSEYEKTKEYDKVLSDKETVYNAERDKKTGEIKQIQDKLNLLSDKEKDAKKQDLEAKVKILQDFDRERQTDLRKEQDDKMKVILKDIEEAIKQHSEKEGYTLVFNDRVLVYQAKPLDITDKIIEILNKGYKK